MSTRLVCMSRDRRADADAGAVDEHVEAAEAVAVRGDDALDVLLRRPCCRRPPRRRSPASRSSRGGGLELVRAAGGDGEAVALLAEDVGDREADPAGGSGDEGGAIGMGVLLSVMDPLSNQGCGLPFVVIAVLFVLLLGVSR